MSDFMKWLYASYIKPQLDAAPQGEYEMAFSLLEGGLEYSYRESMEKAMEFTALHAFALGLRTGRGLSDCFSA